MGSVALGSLSDESWESVLSDQEGRQFAMSGQQHSHQHDSDTEFSSHDHSDQCIDHDSDQCLHQDCDDDSCIELTRLCEPLPSSHHHHDVDCGHEPIFHENHVDFVVDGRLHHSHGGHCDDHGTIENYMFQSGCECETDSPIPPPPNNVPQLPVIHLHDGKAKVGCNCSHQGADVSCRKCRRPNMRVATSTTGVSWQQQIAVAKFVKRRYEENVDAASDIGVLKGLSVDGAEKIVQFTKDYHGILCSTVGTLASLPKEVVEDLIQRDPKVLRTLPALQRAARLIVNPDNTHGESRSLNAQCCAKFRQKKKQKVNQLQQAIEIDTNRCDDLRQKIHWLEQERAQLLEELQRTSQ